MSVTVIKRLLQLLALLAAGVLVAFLVGLVADYGEEHWLPSIRWPVFVVFTVFVFGDVIRNFRRVWSRADFWLTTAVLLFLHTTAYVWVLAQIENWRLIWFLPISIAELGVLLWVLNTFMYGQSK
jgi:hypothetical protein